MSAPVLCERPVFKSECRRNPMRLSELLVLALVMALVMAAVLVGLLVDAVRVEAAGAASVDPLEVSESRLLICTGEQSSGNK